MIVLPENDYNDFLIYLITEYGIKSKEKIENNFLKDYVNIGNVYPFETEHKEFVIKTEKGEARVCDFFVMPFLVERDFKFVTVDDLMKYLNDGEDVTTLDGTKVLSVEESGNNAKLLLFDIDTQDIREFLVFATDKNSNIIIKAVPISTYVAMEVGKIIAEGVTEILPGILELEYEKTYDVLFLTDRKKKYFGYKSNMSFDVKGMEMVRRDWSVATKKVQKQVIDIISQYKDEKAKELAIQFIRDIIRKYHNLEFDLNDVIITKKVRSLDEYKNPERLAQAKVATMLMANGFEVPGGTIVSYVILSIPSKMFLTLQKKKLNHFVNRYDKSKLRVSDRAFPVELVDDLNLLKEYIDVDYILTKQLLPPSIRLLEFMGVNPTIFSDHKNSKLDDFFKFGYKQKKEKIEKINKRVKQLKLG